MTSREDRLRAETVKLAKAVAEAEDHVAETMDALAEQHPDREEHLQSLGDEARKQAARQRQWAEEHCESGDSAGSPAPRARRSDG